MKSGGFKNKGGGLRRKAPSSAPEGISRTRLGELRASDKDYMSALHAARVKPLEIAPEVPRVGVMELHHGPPAVRHSKRRDFDSGVVALDKGVHMGIEDGSIDERQYLGAFADWSAFHYWGWVTLGRIPTGDDAQAFQRWILEQLEDYAEHFDVGRQ